MPGHHTNASRSTSSRRSTGASRGRPSIEELESEESEYSENGTFLGHISGAPLQDLRRRRHEQLLANHRRADDIIARYRDAIVNVIAAVCSKHPADVAGGFDALPLERRIDLAIWQHRPTPGLAPAQPAQSLLHTAVSTMRERLLFDRTPAGTRFRALNSFGPPPRRHQMLSALSVARITTAVRHILREEGLE